MMFYLAVIIFREHPLHIFEYPVMVFWTLQFRTTEARSHQNLWAVVAGRLPHGRPPHGGAAMREDVRRF
jgi:hypothetical protein